MSYKMAAINNGITYLYDAIRLTPILPKQLRIFKSLANVAHFGHRKGADKKIKSFVVTHKIAESKYFIFYELSCVFFGHGFYYKLL